MATSLRSVHVPRSKKRDSEKGIQHSLPQRVGNDKLSGDLLSNVLKVLDSSEVPPEDAILQALSSCEELAHYLQRVSDGLDHFEGEDSPAMKLLFLGEKAVPSPEPQLPSAIAIENGRENVSRTAFEIIKDPKVFITPKILKAYVDIQSLLHRPKSFPEVFKMYAEKPIPIPGTSPIRYKSAKPSNMTSAIPTKTAKTALAAAIRSQNLSLSLHIIPSTLSAPSFHRAKLFQRALVPVSGFALAPAAAYTIASQLSLFQNTMSDEMATKIAFAGILAYVGCTATIGIVAVATANDQMDRVTWAQGTPLRERWLREEERAMMDRVASAWGFKESWRRGEEEGADWEALRELVGLRGMVLDRVELMEGME